MDNPEATTNETKEHEAVQETDTEQSQAEDRLAADAVGEDNNQSDGSDAVAEQPEQEEEGWLHSVLGDTWLGRKVEAAADTVSDVYDAVTDTVGDVAEAVVDTAGDAVHTVADALDLSEDDPLKEAASLESSTEKAEEDEGFWDWLWGEGDESTEETSSSESGGFIDWLFNDDNEGSAATTEDEKGWMESIGDTVSDWWSAAKETAGDIYDGLTNWGEDRAKDAAMAMKAGEDLGHLDFDKDGDRVFYEGKDGEKVELIKDKDGKIVEVEGGDYKVDVLPDGKRIVRMDNGDVIEYDPTEGKHKITRGDTVKEIDEKTGDVTIKAKDANSEYEFVSEIPKPEDMEPGKVYIDRQSGEIAEAVGEGEARKIFRQIDTNTREIEVDGKKIRVVDSGDGQPPKVQMADEDGQFKSIGRTMMEKLREQGILSRTKEGGWDIGGIHCHRDGQTDTPRHRYRRTHGPDGKPATEVVEVDPATGKPVLDPETGKPPVTITVQPDKQVVEYPDGRKDIFTPEGMTEYDADGNQDSFYNFATRQLTTPDFTLGSEGMSFADGGFISPDGEWYPSQDYYQAETIASQAEGEAGTVSAVIASKAICTSADIGYAGAVLSQATGGMAAAMAAGNLEAVAQLMQAQSMASAALQRATANVINQMTLSSRGLDADASTVNNETLRTGAIEEQQRDMHVRQDAQTFAGVSNTQADRVVEVRKSSGLASDRAVGRFVASQFDGSGKIADRSRLHDAMSLDPNAIKETVEPGEDEQLVSAEEIDTDDETV